MKLKSAPVTTCDRCGRSDDTLIPHADGKRLCHYCTWRADELAEAIQRRERHERLVREMARRLRDDPPPVPRYTRKPGLFQSWPRLLLLLALALTLIVAAAPLVSVWFRWLGL